MQGHIAQYITGGLKGTTYDILETHTYIPPVDLLFRKVQASATTWICTLLTNHPLHPITCKATHRFINHYKSPLHYLFHATQLSPQIMETPATACRHPSYKPSLSTKISPSKDLALELAHKMHHSFKYKAYSDGSNIKGGVSMSAILYKYNRPIKIKRYHLGPQTKHTVYDAELVGIILAISLLTDLTSQISSKALIGLNNQASIHACTQ